MTELGKRTHGCFINSNLACLREKGQEGSRTVKKGQERSRAVKNGQEGSRRIKKGQKTAAHIMLGDAYNDYENALDIL